MGIKEASRALEFTNPKMHAGWQGEKPVFVVFSLETARQAFEEYPKWGAVVICVAAPYAVRAENSEQAVHFFSDDKVAAIVAEAIFTI